MPLIDISLARGRSPEQIRALIGAVHSAAERTIGADSENITVVVREVDREHWSRSNLTVAERAAAASSPADSNKE